MGLAHQGGPELALNDLGPLLLPNPPLNSNLALTCLAGVALDEYMCRYLQVLDLGLRWSREGGSSI